jgi:hypothetical protein
MSDSQLPKPGIIYPNDYTLINLLLLTPVAAFDVKNILVELSYNEDLFTNSASGYLMVADSTGYIEKLNMNGNEFIRMTFGKVDSSSNIIDKIFRVFKVAKRTPENEGNTETYSLYFCSEELVISEQHKVNKSYKAKDITTNVIDILQNYLKVPKNKLGMIEQTLGVYDFIVPNLKPFDAINWMSTYARPDAKKYGADFLFFEDKFGYNFRSIQSLIAQPTYNTYSYNPKNINQTMTDKVYNVSTYEIMDSYDTLGAINSGIFANQLISVDPLLRRYKITNFDYGAYSQAAKKLNNSPITNNFKNRFDEGINQTPQAVTKLIFSNSNQTDSNLVKTKGGVAHDIFAETYVPYRTAQLPLLNYTRVKLSVPGDPGLTIGRVISFNLLSKDAIKKEPDGFYSGNYLITAVRHLLTIHKYTTILELAKDSTVNMYSSVDNNLPIWKNTAMGIIK